MYGCTLAPALILVTCFDSTSHIYAMDPAAAGCMQPKLKCVPLVAYKEDGQCIVMRGGTFVAQTISP